MKTITEIQIIPIKPQNGLIAFSSFILYESIYCSSVAISTKPDGNYRLIYPTKKVNQKDMNIFYPINKKAGDLIEKEVIKKLKEVMNYDRYGFNNNIPT